MSLQWIVTLLVVGASAAYALKTLLGAALSRGSGCAGCERNAATPAAAREQPLVFQPRPIDLSPSPIGSGKCTFSATPGSVRTDTAPSARKRAVTCCARMSGADAPAVSPTRRLPTNHSARTSSGLSTM